MNGIFDRKKLFHFGIKKNYIDIVKFLIENGFYLRIRN